MHFEFFLHKYEDGFRLILKSKISDGFIINWLVYVKFVYYDHKVRPALFHRIFT